MVAMAMKREGRLVRWIRSFAGVVTIGAIASATSGVPVAHAQTPPSVALFYGMHPPIEKLSAFDIAVVDPDAQFDPLAQIQSPSEAQIPPIRQTQAHTAWFAYVSVGEVNPHRAYFADVPKAWMPSINKDWESHVVDQTSAGWPKFFIDRVIGPLWRKGYRGFFLDTLDSYQLISHTEAQRTAQQAGLIKVIRAIKSRYPKAQLIFNRGFEVLPQLHDQAYMVAFESLYSGWDAGKQAYTQVPQADRDWLLGQARTVRDQYGLPVLSIDYCPPSDSACQRSTVERIVGDGLLPYVTDGGLQTVGVGAAVLSPPSAVAGGVGAADAGNINRAAADGDSSAPVTRFP
jgi:uncharacterized protein (TIGR01370 family)